ncbi:unnamed protein product [Rhizophagus irregularis]|nr:unnamed protein product [Rhizophagus irregularis]
MSSSSLRKVGGRPISKIWEWFVKGDLVLNSKGYYLATCSFCEYHWSTAKVAKLKKHFAYECTKVDSDTKISILMMLTNNCDDSEDNSYDTSTTSTTKSKKRKSNDRSQTHIDDHYENFPTPLGKEDQINKALAKMFVLTETLIIQEISRINLKVNRIINEENNMTIAFDGWTNPTGQSIYNYCLITEDRKEYLWCSKDYSNVPHHTGAFLGDEIIKIVNNIGPERLAAVVSDNAPDARGGLKSHTKTRWSTMWDCVSSIVRLELAFARVLSEHENDIKNRVTVGCLESRTSMLADCYVHLLSLASAIYRMSNQNIQFKNHCIIKFNERFHEFSDDLFLLAFFLHPHYHGNGINLNQFHNITLKAAQIWKDMGHNQDSCAKLLTQLRKYMKKKTLFNQNYNYKSDTPTIWWETAQNSKKNGSYKLWHFNFCSANRVEGMCKLHTYYITNAKRELPYYAIDTSENSMREKMINTIVEISNELEVNDFDFLYNENIIDMVIDMSQSYDLDVTLNIDIESQIFNMERREPENEVTVDQNRQTVVLAPERKDFDIEALIAKEIDDNEN